MTASSQPTKNQLNQRRYRARHLERCREKCRISYQKHKDRYKAKKRISNHNLYLHKREEKLAYNKLYYLKNRERLLAHQKLITDKEKAKQKSREWWKKYGRDPEVVLRNSLRGKKYYQSKKQETLIRNKTWRKLNPHKVKEFRLKRRALEKSAEINRISIAEWIKSVKSKRFATCYYCGDSILSSDVHFDHIIPLSKGGPHSVENLCVSCEWCNLSKGSKMPKIWITMGQQLLAL